VKPGSAPDAGSPGTEVRGGKAGDFVGWEKIVAGRNERGVEYKKDRAGRRAAGLAYASRWDRRQGGRRGAIRKKSHRV
jgi:hypothetical protein